MDAQIRRRKTGGRVSAAQVVLIPLEVIRTEGPVGVQRILENAPSGSVCVADGVADSDAQVVAAAVGTCSRGVLARVAASYVRARAGLMQRPLLQSTEMQADGHGGLVVVGSHVPKSTSQLEHLLQNHSDCRPLELNVMDLQADRSGTIESLLDEVTELLNQDQNVVLYTSRQLATADCDQGNLNISKLVSTGLVEIVNRLTVRPRYLIAKGGITSSDVATQGLEVERALVVGSILPGVPVWRLGEESHFPGMHYVIFPGNVGGDEALSAAVEKLK